MLNVNKFYLFLLLCSGCVPMTQYNDRLNHGIASISASVVQNGAMAATTGTFDWRQIYNQGVFTGGSEIQSQIYDDYYEHLRREEAEKAWQQYYYNRNNFRP